VAALVGGYQLIQRLAVGGMAEVFLARRGSERFALKRILPHLSDRAHFVSLFLDEARLAARLCHPHIVRVHDFGRDGGAWWLAMEHVAGEDLATVVARARTKRAPIAPVDAALLVAQACDGLDHAHQRGVVHCDVTPSNLLVGWDGVVKLADFGIARPEMHNCASPVGAPQVHNCASPFGAPQVHNCASPVGAPEVHNCASPVGAPEVHNCASPVGAPEVHNCASPVGAPAAGTRAYMSPEQARGERLDRRSDVYSLGVCAWELVTGTRLRRADGPRPAPSRSRALPPELLEIVSTAFEPARERRFASARAFGEALRGWLAGAAASPARLSAYLQRLFGPDAAERTRRLELPIEPTLSLP